MTEIDIESAELVGANRLPRLCVRHGNLVSEGIDVDLQSRPRHDKTPTYGGVLALTVRTVDHLDKIQRVSVQGWPFCPDCLRRRRLIRTTAGIMLFGGLMLVAIAAAIRFGIDSREPLLIVPFLLGVGAAIGSGFVFGQSSWSHIAGARVTDDGNTVTFSSPHARVIEELRDITLTA